MSKNARDFMHFEEIGTKLKAVHFTDTKEPLPSVHFEACKTSDNLTETIPECTETIPPNMVVPIAGSIMTNEPPHYSNCEIIEPVQNFDNTITQMQSIPYQQYIFNTSISISNFIQQARTSSSNSFALPDDVPGNFTVRPVRRNRINTILDSKLEITVELKLLNGETQLHILHGEDCSNIFTTLKKLEPSIHVNADYSNGKARGAQATIENQFSDALQFLREEQTILYPGWYFIESGSPIYTFPGRNLLVGNTMVHFENTSALFAQPQAKRSDVFTIFQHLNQLITTSTGAKGILLLYMFSGLLFPCFEHSNFSIRFLLFIHGQSGAFKTSVSELLFKIATPASKTLKFYDTLASLDSELSDARHSIVLIDDFKNNDSGRLQGNMDSVLEYLIRFSGDGQGKNRSSSNLESKRIAEADETLVITGERIKGQYSSLLRCVLLDLNRGDIDSHTLSYFQDHKCELVSLLSHFALYIENQYSQIVNHISQKVESYRSIYRCQYQQSRTVDQAVTFSLFRDILHQFFVAYCNAPSDAVSTLITHLQHECLIALHRSEDLASSNSCNHIYARSIYRIYTLRKNLFAKLDIQYFSNTSAFIGYSNNETLFCDPNFLYVTIKKHLSELGTPLLDSMTSCHKELADIGVVKRYSNGGNNYKYTIRKTYDGETYNVIPINLQKLRTIAENEANEI